jgi:PilZ domain
MDRLGRTTERDSCNFPASIRTDDASFSVSCTVRNISEAGARLVLERTDPLPAEFILLLRPTSSIGRRCQTVWQLGDKAGVRFVSVDKSNLRDLKGSGVWAPTF